MKIGIVTEGGSDERFLRDTLPQLAPQIEWKIKSCGGFGRLYKQADNHYREMVYAHMCSHVIFLVDSDGKCPLERRHLIESKISQTIRPWCVSIMCIELESWFLADAVALLALGITYVSPGLTDSLSKESLIKLCEKAGILFTETDFADLIKAHFSYERALTYNNSLQHFCNKINEWLL